jgi:hypothetical protein
MTLDCLDSLGMARPVEAAIHNHLIDNHPVQSKACLFFSSKQSASDIQSFRRFESALLKVGNNALSLLRRKRVAVVLVSSDKCPNIFSCVANIECIGS